MSTSALIGRRPTARSRCCSHSGEGPFLTPLISRPANIRQTCGSSFANAQVDADRALAAGRGLGRNRAVLQRAEAIGGEIAGDAVDPRRVAAIGGDRDVDHDAAELRIVDIALAHRRILGQLDDAVMVVAELELARRAQHAVRRRAADIALGEGEVAAGDIGAGEGEDALHAGAGIGRAADHVDQFAGAGIDLADPAACRHWGASRPRRHARRRTASAPPPDRRSPRPRARSWSAPRRSRRPLAVVSRCSLSQSRVNFICICFRSLRSSGSCAGDLEEFGKDVGKAARVVDGAVRVFDIAVPLGRHALHAPLQVLGAAQGAGHGVEADAAAAEDLPRLVRPAEHPGAGEGGRDSGPSTARRRSSAPRRRRGSREAIPPSRHSAASPSPGPPGSRWRAPRPRAASPTRPWCWGRAGGRGAG